MTFNHLMRSFIMAPRLSFQLFSRTSTQLAGCHHGPRQSGIANQQYCGTSPSILNSSSTKLLISSSFKNSPLGVSFSTSGFKCAKEDEHTGYVRMPFDWEQKGKKYEAASWLNRYNSTLKVVATAGTITGGLMYMWYRRNTTKNNLSETITAHDEAFAQILPTMSQSSLALIKPKSDDFDYDR